MTPVQQRGFNDQKAGTINEPLFQSDSQAGFEYREGCRMAKREAAFGTSTEIKQMPTDVTPQAVADVHALESHANAFVDPTPGKRRRAQPKTNPDQLGFF